MTSARRTISVQPPVAVGKNIVARIDGVTALDLNFLNSDGVNLSFHTRNSDLFVFDTDLNLVAQRNHTNLSGGAYGKGQIYSPTTLLGGTSYAGILNIVSGAWRHALYTITGPGLTIPSTPQHLYLGSAGGAAQNRVFIQADASFVYVAYITNGQDLIIIKYDTSLVEQSRTYTDEKSRMIIGWKLVGSTLYLAHENVGYQFAVITYDLNLNLTGRVSYTTSATHAASIHGVDFADGFLYVATSTRNPTHVQYDLALWKISTDLTSYDVVFCDTTVLASGPGVYGCNILNNGNIALVGSRFDNTNHHFTILEFDTNLDIVNQIQDNTNLGAGFENAAANAIGDSVYLATVTGGSAYITRIDDRNFPVATTPPCDSQFTWQNTSLTFTKASGSFTVTTPGTLSPSFTTDTPNMTDSATSYSLAAQCEF